MKRILSLVIILAMILSSIGVFAAEETAAPKFSDVDANSVSGQAIYKLVGAGVLNGYPDGTFRPNNTLTRAELCKIVNLVFGYTEAAPDTFTDVSTNDWFYSYVAIAKKAGYITGHADGTFKGNDFLTREQACAIITRVTELYDLSMTETITDEVSAWAVPYVNKVVANKLMLLEEGGKFRATENITRGELTSVMAVFVKDTVEEDKVEEDKKPETGKKPSGGGGSAGGGGSTGGGSTGGGSTGGGTTGGGSTGGGSTGGGSTGGGTTGGGSTTPSEPVTPVIDQAKQEQAKTSMGNMLTVLNGERFSSQTGAKTVIDHVKNAINAALDDADEGIAIYEDDYVFNLTDDKGNNYIDMALDAYDEMNVAAQNSFKSQLVKLKKTNYDEMNELSKLLFGISIDVLEDKIEDKVE